MIINSNELIGLFESLYEKEEQAKDIRKEITDNLQGFADTHELGKKSVKAAYTLFKQYRSGKNTVNECDEYEQLTGMVDLYFQSGVADKNDL